MLVVKVSQKLLRHSEGESSFKFSLCQTFWNDVTRKPVSSVCLVQFSKVGKLGQISHGTTSTAEIRRSVKDIIVAVKNEMEI